MRYTDYDRDEMENTQNYRTIKPQEPKGNSALVAVIAVLSSVLVILIAATILVATGVISIGKDKNENTNQAAMVTSQSQEENPTAHNVVDVAPQPVSVERTMYVGNCNVSITLRTGPGTDYSEICQLPLGEAIYVIEYTDESFAKVAYNGNTGYALRKYIVSTRPEVWDYNEADAISFVEGSLRAFVRGINKRSTSYVYDYFAGAAAEEEIQSHNAIVKNVLTEEILSVYCHSVERVSASKISVIRESTIRVTYNDGTVKDIPEKYKYTIDLSSGRMHIVGLQAM